MAKAVPAEVLPPSLDLEKYRSEAATFGAGLKTFQVAAQSLLDRGLETDEDYTACVALGVEARGREKKIADFFEGGCKAANMVHKFLTGLRAECQRPWATIRESLEAHSRKWYLEQEAAKKAAEQQIGKVVTQQQRQLAEEAQELIAMGYVREAEDKLRQAQVTVAPILPDAAPKVEGARVTQKYVGKVTDLMAVIKAVADGTIPLMHVYKAGEERPLLELSDPVLRAIVDRMGKSTNIPGISVELDVKFSGAKY